MDEITQRRRDKIVKEHLTEVDIILTELIDELGDTELTVTMMNDLFKIAFQKWEFLYEYGLIKKAPL